MADIGNNYNPIVEADNELKIDFINIQINEKTAQKSQLNLTLDKIKSVEIKKIELQIKVLDREIIQLQEHLMSKMSIEATAISDK